MSFYLILMKPHLNVFTFEIGEFFLCDFWTTRYNSQKNFFNIMIFHQNKSLFFILFVTFFHKTIYTTYFIALVDFFFRVYIFSKGKCYLNAKKYATINIKNCPKMFYKRCTYLKD